MSDIPPPPPGFTLVDEPAPRPRRARTAPTSNAPPPPPGFEVLDDDHPEARDLIGKPTGEVHDGDTFRMDTGANARLYGADAFELNQTGRDRSGALVPLGTQARGVLQPFAQPDALVTATGSSTYGRPVVTLNNGSDAGDALLRSGLAIATPDYLKVDRDRLTSYMEAERFARQNGRGAWSTAFEQPASYRHKTPDPWAKQQPAQAGDATAVFNDEPMPFQGLRPEIARGYASIFQDMASKPEDLIAYAKANGFQIDEGETRKRYAQRTKAGGAGNVVSYQDPPRVLTDNKDGALGSFARGVADPINMLDELGAVVDTVVPNDRENVWSSDRRFGDILANNLDQNRSILAFDDSEHPYARFGGQLAGGLITPGASIEGLGYRTAAEVLRNGGTRFAAEQAARQAVVRRLGAAGAIEGGLAGVGQGEDARGRFQGALIGAPAGLALGTAAGVAAPALGRLIGRPFNRLAGRNGEQAAQDLTDGAIDTAKSRASNDISAADLIPDAAVARDADDLPTQAMANETATPTLYAPDDVPSPPAGFTMLEGDEAARAIDGLSANARPLLDNATAAERAAQADGVRPTDVLPLPANTVDGVDEAARIEAGRYASVRAPNEDAELTSRTLPSGTTGVPIRKRGPADLVTWLRSEGGIRAQGGELQHYGIDNTPRQGMDFAGGEGRFGALVRNDGMTYDDAAQRAWEAGFFPDYAERPTVAEFLGELQETHSGGNRAFRPDDLAEVDAFETARRQRFNVEQARDQGALLSEDRSQPIGPDDLDANAPPVQAYEEWGENAPNLAGNIRLDKLDSPQDIKRALVDADRRVGGFDAATRGRITHAETERLASDLGMKADDLLKRRKGQAFNAEEALAARQLLARSGTDLVNMAKRIQRMDTPGEEVEAAFKQAWLRHVAIQEQVSGMTAEAGRALSAFRIAANSSAVDRVLPSLGDIAGGASRLKDVADRIVDLEASGVGPGGVNSFTVKALKPRFQDKLVELYYNSLLSGPQTHVTNMLGNTLTAIGQIPEHAVAAAIGGARRVVRQGDADRVLFSELGARTVGMMQGAREGLAAAARTVRTGEAADAVTKVEQQTQRAISGVKGSIIRTPTRFLAAEDELFKGIARRMELAGIAVREAAKEGLSGAEAKARAAELLADPTDAMLARSFEYGRYLTFQNALGPVGRHVTAVTEAMPGLKLILPFVRTPTNILKFAVERSPAAPLLKEWRNDIAAGGAKRDMALARVMVGTGVAATIFQMAQDGQITGGGPADKEAKRLLMTTGWQPYSFKIGNRYVSYQRLDPYSTTIGTAADVVDLQHYMTDKQRDNSALLVGTAILHNLGSKTWLSGLSDALEALNDPDRSLESFTSRMAGSIAVPAVVAQAARTADPVLREARAPLDRIRSRVPGLSQNLLPRRDAFGRPITTEGGLGPDIISPIWASTERPDGTVDALLAVGAHVTAPNKKVGGRELSPAEYDRWQQIAGATVKPQLDALVGVAGWNALPAEERKDMIDDVVSKARRQARKTFLGGAASQGAMPPPPPGFTVVQ